MIILFEIKITNPEVVNFTKFGKLWDTQPFSQSKEFRKIKEPYKHFIFFKSRSMIIKKSECTNEASNDCYTLYT